MRVREITTVDLISRALTEIDAAIAQVQPSMLDSDDAFNVWESLEPIQEQLGASLDRLDDLLTSLVDRM
ncbi:MAG: hypothetical protein Fur0046_17530 [Cyanobacteria bacterium J069]|nr:MAG: hypothetical protein D6742_01050 [Cyanobacteria bacterium J069]